MSDKTSGITPEKRARFSYCEKIKCPLRFNCKEKLVVRAARDIGAWGLDYWCMKINDIVYKEWGSKWKTK